MSFFAEIKRHTTTCDDRIQRCVQNIIVEQRLPCACAAAFAASSVIGFVDSFDPRNVSMHSAVFAVRNAAGTHCTATIDAVTIDTFYYVSHFYPACPTLSSNNYIKDISEIYKMHTM